MKNVDGWWDLQSFLWLICSVVFSRLPLFRSRVSHSTTNSTKDLLHGHIFFVLTSCLDLEDFAVKYTTAPFFASCWKIDWSFELKFEFWLFWMQKCEWLLDMNASKRRKWALIQQNALNLCKSMPKSRLLQLLILFFFCLSWKQIWLALFVKAVRYMCMYLPPMNFCHFSTLGFGFCHFRSFSTIFSATADVKQKMPIMRGAKFISYKWRWPTGPGLFEGDALQLQWTLQTP